MIHEVATWLMENKTEELRVELLYELYQSMLGQKT
jgi:hypothetical protein